MQCVAGFFVCGDSNENLMGGSWLEGSWMNKHNGKYYLQYAGPGTQFKSYGDGVLVGDSPLGPFTYAPYSPFSFKPTGFITGAGHGSTFTGLDGRFWHIATMTVSVRHSFERRLGLFPTTFLPDGELVTDTYLGDYPHYLGGKRGPVGWMLLSRNKPVTVSSTLPGHAPENAINENIRTWWSAATGDDNEWIQVDLSGEKRVDAVQINFADEGSTTLGRSSDTYRYILEASQDGKAWKAIVDHSHEGRDSPHDYEVLPRTIQARYIRLRNVHSPNGAKFSISGLRVFGKGQGSAPGRVDSITAARDATDPRHATVRWQPVPNADFYIVRLGTSPDALTQNYQIYDATTAEIRSLNSSVDYYLTIDAVNENGITQGITHITLTPPSAK